MLDFGQVQVQIQVRPITTAGLTAYLDGETRRIRALLSQRDALAPRKAIIIVDGSVSLMPPAEARNIQRRWFTDNHDLLRLVTHEMGFVLPNALLRGFMSAVFYLSSPPVPMITHGSLDEAVQWAIRKAESIQGQVNTDLLKDGSIAVERARRLALSAATAS